MYLIFVSVTKDEDFLWHLLNYLQKNGTGERKESRESSAISTLASMDKENFQQDAHFQAALLEIEKDSFKLDQAGVQEMSHEPVAFNENDILGMDCASYNHIPNNSCHADVHGGQERLVLVNFLTCLTKLISSGNLKGKCVCYVFGL